MVQYLIFNRTFNIFLFMQSYTLLREDLDNVNELALWPNMRDQMDKVDSKTKAAFTRQVNKELFVPYSVVKVVSKRGKGGGGGDGEDELEEGLDEGEGEEGAAGGGSEEEEEEDLDKDAMIKVKKSKGKAGESSGRTTSKGKASKTDSKGKKDKK